MPTISKSRLLLAACLSFVIVAGCAKSEDSEPLPPSPGAENLKSEGGDNTPARKADGNASAEGS